MQTKLEASDTRRRCFLLLCRAPAGVEAIGTYGEVFGIEEIVALVLCERLGDELVTLEVA